MRIVFVLPALAAAFSLAAKASPRCGKDTDCKGNLVCDNGRCVAQGGQATAASKAATPASAKRAACSEPTRCFSECADGIGRSCLILGGMYEDGIGVAQDDGRARKFYGSACTLGDQDGCAKVQGIQAASAQKASDANRAQAAHELEVAQQQQAEKAAARQRCHGCMNAAKTTADACMDSADVREEGCAIGTPEFSQCHRGVLAAKRGCNDQMSAGFARCKGAEPPGTDCDIDLN